MPYLKRSFTYKDEKKALVILKQGMFIEDVTKYPQFVQTLLKNGNYLVDEKVDPDKGIIVTTKPQIPVKLEQETHVNTIKIADLPKDEEESEKKSKSKDGQLAVKTVTQQGATIPLNSEGKIAKVNQDSINAVKGTDIKVADTVEPESLKVVESVSDNVDIPESVSEGIEKKGEGVLVVNKNPKPRPQGKRNKK